MTAGLYCRARIDRSTIRRHDADRGDSPIAAGFLDKSRYLHYLPCDPGSGASACADAVGSDGPAEAGRNIHRTHLLIEPMFLLRQSTIGQPRGA